MEAFAGVLDVLPPRLRGLDLSKVSELRLRAGQAPALLVEGKEQRLSGLVRQDELSEILRRATGNSLYACMDALRQGFVTLPGGHRVGVCGEAVQKGGAMAGFSAVSSLCIRLARDIRVDEKLLLPHLSSSSLILGPPGSGKTTLLRACVRALSQSEQRVCVSDERGEIAAMCGGAAQFDLGPQTDVLSNLNKASGMMLLLRAMDPQWIAADEITAQCDIAAMEQISYCGVKLLATAHAQSISELHARPLYRALLSLEIFKTAFVLQPDRSFTVEEVGA